MTGRSAINRPMIGRFAPSPTGELHLGSLTTAVASYCQIKSLGGSWLLRLEDTDIERCSSQFSDQILIDLERLGLHWDSPVLYQSGRTDIYNELLHIQLTKRLYACTCSRKQLQPYQTYPRFCLPHHLTNLTNSPHQAVNNHPIILQSATTLKSTDNTLAQNPIIEDSLYGAKVRVQLPDYYIGFLDTLQGMQWVNPQQTLGDVVLRRLDGIVNYFLAVSIDDGLQGITHIMRGLDILPLTTAQIALMQYLELPSIEAWSHLPLIENKQGQKLSKQNLATPIDTDSIEKCQKLLHQVLRLLMQPTVDTDTPIKMLAQATSQWQNRPLINKKVLAMV